MTKIRIAKIAGIAAGATLVFGSFIPMAGAVTIAELQAQINALMAQLAALQGSTVSTGTTFTQNLTVGSTGAEVTALQQVLVAQGRLVMPAGVAMGYFGSLTQAAVASWQAANGVSPAAGYWGPISRAKYASMAGTPGTTVPGSTVGITTPGVEGTLTATLNPSPASGTKVYEGGSKTAVLGIKIEADISDIRVERVKVQLDATTSGNSDQQFYTKIADMMYVMDGSTVLASSVLDATTVVKEGSAYYMTIAGFSFLVPKDTTKVLTIAIDPKASWDSTYDSDTWTLTVPANGVRGVDGAGINQYSPTAALTAQSFTSTADVVDSAALTVSLATDSPKVSQVIANSGGSSNEKDNLVLAKINFKAEDDQVKVTDLTADITRSGTQTTATATTAYIYEGGTISGGVISGGTLVGSAAVAGTTLPLGTAAFTNIDWIIPADTTKTLTLAIDVDSAGVAFTSFAGSVGSTTAVATAIASENSAGTSITETGAGEGRFVTVRKIGPEVTLVSKSVTTDGVAQGAPAAGLTSTSTLTATFNIKIKAVGGTLNLGTVASTSPVVASSTAGFKVYRNGAYDGTVSSGATSTSYTIPTGCSATGTESCNLSDSAEVTIPITFSIQGRAATGVASTNGLYAVGFEGITWHTVGGASQTTTFMAGDSDWRTADVSFP